MSRDRRISGEPSRRWRRIAALATGTALAWVGVAATGPAADAASSQLIRYPYLTDVTATSVQVTFDTTVKLTSATGAVRWGTPSGASGCTLTGSSATNANNSLNAPITVAGVTEYISSLQITGLTAGTQYCYRVFTGGAASVDLLGTDVAPRFRTLSSTGPVTFDVLGDWGDTSVAGGANQANVDALIATSGAQFAVSTGDIAYDTGTQTNYGNLVATGTATSEIFGPGFWKVPGASLPLFATTGNHGRSLTFLQNWKQPATVAASGGTYAMQTYAGQDGTTSASYPSVWYAFDAGGARFYVINSDWNDNNFGTAAGGAYQADRDYHWQTTSPEYQWLKADLAAHSNAVKFAFFHYPLRSDSATEKSDTFLQNDPNNPTSVANLEGLLANNGVDLAFNGHAHLYQRNVAPPGGVTSYVTGGGGGKVSPVNKSACSPTDAYAIGWAYTGASGSACGAAVTLQQVPTTDAKVYHFLKVSLSGTTVTVTPTASDGSTFDQMTYNFGSDPTAPVAPTGLLATAVGTTVKLSWTASASSNDSATDVYRNGSWLATVPASVVSYTDAAPVAGASYTVRAHSLARLSSPDSAPASVGSGSDTSPPTPPGGFTATATAATSVKLAWTASTDNVGVTGYDIFRDGTAIAHVNALSYVDNTVAASSTYSYTVAAHDAAGNVSSPNPTASATTPAAGGGGSATFTATDDATVDSTNPDVSAPTGTRLTADGSPVNDFLVKFNVSSLPAGCVVSNASLQLTVGTSTNNNSVKGGNLFRAALDTWTQTGLTWNNAPAATGSAIASLGAVTLGETVSVNVTPFVSGTGLVSFRMSNTSSDAAQYFSKEGSSTLPPKLVVTC